MFDDDLDSEAKARVGLTLKEKWQLVRLLGVGGMCAVYEARHRNGARLAIKILHARYAADGEVRRRFQREGYLANSVDHPGRVQVFDDDEEQGLVFLVMELLEGRSLETERERAGGRLLRDQALSITERVLDVL